MNKKILTAAVSVALLAGSGSALAGTRGVSILNITDFAFTDGAGTTLTLGGGSQITAATGSNTADANADYDGFVPPDDSDTDSANVPPGVTVGACAEVPVAGGICPPVVPADYVPPASPATPSGVDHAFGHADIDGSALDAGGATTANARTRAETDMTTTGTSDPLSSSAASNAGLQLNLTPGAGTTSVSVEFDAELFLSAFNDLGSAFPTQSQVASRWDITFEDNTTGNLVTWSPNGQVIPADPNGGCTFTDSGGNPIAPGVIFSCSGESDPFNLTQSRGRVAPNNNGIVAEADPGIGAFAITFSGFTPGQTYDVTIRHTSESDSTIEAVPEPASLALLSTGLLGLGAVVRRRSRKH